MLLSTCNGVFTSCLARVALQLFFFFFLWGDVIQTCSSPEKENLFCLLVNRVRQLYCCKTLHGVYFLFVLSPTSVWSVTVAF